MKPILLLSLLIFISCQKDEEHYYGEWQSLEVAYKKAALDDKPIFLDAWAEWCHPCKIIEKNIYSKDKWQQEIKKNFHLAKLNVEQKDKILCNNTEETPYKCMELHWKTEGLPAALILNKNGELLDSQLGLMTVEDFKLFLQGYLSQKK